MKKVVNPSRLGAELLLLVLLMALIPSPAFGQPGSSFSTALLASALSYSYSLDAGSSHYYKIYLARGETIDVTLRTLGDFTLSLYDVNQVELVSSTQQADGQVKNVEHLAKTSGYYYILVKNNGDSEESYLLTIKFPNPGSTPSAALPILDSTYNYTISPYENHYFKIDLKRGDILTAYISVPENLDISLYLYDSKDALLASSARQGLGVKEAIQYPIETPGTYYILVHNEVGEYGTYHLTTGIVGFEVTYVGWGSLASPIEVEPGDVGVDLVVSVRQLSSYTLSNIKATLYLSEEFSTLTGERTVEDTYDKALQQGGVASFSFTLNIASDADLGNYDMKMMIEFFKLSNGRLVYQNPFNLTMTATVTGKSYIKITPSSQQLSLGETSQILLDIVNEGTAEANSIEMSIIVPPPLVLKGSDNKWLISSLMPGESTSISLLIYTPSSTPSQTYQLSISLTYRTVVGSTKSETRSISLMVKEDVDVHFDLKASKQELLPKETTDVLMTISNLGPVAASSLQITLTPPNPLVIVGEDNRWFLGSLEVGENATILVSIYAPESSQGLSYTFNVDIDYETPTGVEKSEVRSISFTVVSVKDARFTVFVEGQSLEPGLMNDLNITIRNDGPYNVKTVEIILSVPQPLTLFEKDDRWSFSSIEVGQSVVISAKVFAPYTAQSRSYSLGLSIEYETLTGIKKSDSRALSVTVKELKVQPLLTVSITDQTITSGSDKTLELFVVNEGELEASSISLSLTLTPPLLLLEKDDRWFIPSLKPDEGTKVLASVRAPSGTPEGTYSVSLSFSYTLPDGSIKAQSNVFTLRVEKAKEPVLEILFAPYSLVAGMVNEVSLKIINKGPGKLSSIDVIIDVPKPLTIVGQTNRWYVGELEENESATISLQIYPPSGSLGVTVLPTITLSYKDVYGDVKREVRTAGLTVVGKAKEPIIEIEFAPYSLTAGLVNDVALFVTNKGPGDVSSLDVSLTIPQPLSIVGRANRWYVGDLKENSSAQLQLQVYAPSGSAGLTVQPTVVISYKDAKGELKEVIQTIALAVITSVDSGVRFKVETDSYDLVASIVNEVRIKVKNVGEASARNITIALDLPQPLSLVGGDNKWYTPIMMPGDDFVIETKVFVPEDALGGSYQSRLTFNYKDGSGYDRSEALTLGFSAKGYSDLRATGFVLNPLPALIGRSLTVSGTLINGGLIPARMVNVSLLPEGPFRAGRGSSTLISEIPKDGQSSFSITVFVEQPSEFAGPQNKSLQRRGIYPLKLLILYKDDRNELNEERITLRIPVSAPSPAPVTTPQPSGPIGFLLTFLTDPFILGPLAFVLGILLTAIVYRRRRRTEVELLFEKESGER